MLAGGALAYYLLAVACIYLSRQPQSISTMWLPDAFASIWLLALARRQRLFMLAAIGGVIPLANFSHGDDWATACSFVPSNLLQIALAAWLLGRFVRPAQAVRDPVHLLKALLLGSGLPAAAGATLAALTVPVISGTPLGPSEGHLWLSWLVSSFFGGATLLPLGLWILARGLDLQALRTPLAAWGLLGVVLVAWLAPATQLQPFAYLVVTLVAAALFGGFVVAAVAALLASVLLNAMYALGLFAIQRAGLPADAAPAVVPMLLTVVPTTLVGAIREGMRRQLAQVREGEALLRSMLDASPVLLCMVDQTGRIVRMNAAGARMLGAQAPADLVGRRLAALFTTGSPAEPGLATLTTLDGRQLRVELYRSAVNAGAMGSGTVYALRDITEELEAQRLREHATRVEAQSRAKSELLSRMSHELRTPLNAVLGFAQLMQASLGQASRERQLEQLGQIQQAGWHLLGMIDDVLDLSRIEAGKASVRLEPVALASALEVACSMLQAEAERRHVRVSVAPPSAGAGVMADPLRLRQVLINLLSNAIKYNREGGSVDITCTRVDAGRAWRIEVRDTGLGIRAEQQAHVFEPFNRLDQAHSKVAGTGIGMSIARQLVEAMGGRIGLHSEVSVGSTFWIELPAQAAPTAAAAPLPASARVLYVEDDEASVKLVRETLALDRIEVLHAADMAQATAMLPSVRPQLLLWSLPAVDESGVVPPPATAMAGVARVAVSARGTASDRAAAAALGFSNFVAKPYDLQQLRATVAGALRRGAE
ncbi:MAG: ATP-binding protein [Pseudomonadota bacterium]